MESIKNIVSQVVGDLTLRKPEKQIKIQRLWERIIGDKDNKHTMIIELKEGTLLVNVDAPARQYQFNLRKKKILDQLSEEIPDIKKIVFTIGKVQ